MVIRLLIMFFCVGMISCRPGKDNGEVHPLSSAAVQDSLIKMNRSILRKDIINIEEYIDSTGRKMHKTGTGLFIDLVVDSAGTEAKAGDILFFTYKVKTLKGSLIYSSDESGKKEFIVDQSGLISGWNEAAKLMSQADSAVIILPPHLAFRNVGDGNRIGPGEILICELRLDSLVRRSVEQ